MKTIDVYIKGLEDVYATSSVDPTMGIKTDYAAYGQVSGEEFQKPYITTETSNDTTESTSVTVEASRDSITFPCSPRKPFSWIT